MMGYDLAYRYAFEGTAYGLEVYLVYTLLAVAFVAGALMLVRHDDCSSSHRLIASFALFCALGIAVDILFGMASAPAYVLWSGVGACAIVLLTRYTQTVLARGVSLPIGGHTLRRVLVSTLICSDLLILVSCVMWGHLYEYARFMYAFTWAGLYAACIISTAIVVTRSYRLRTSVREREQIVVNGGIVLLALVVYALLHIAPLSLLGYEAVAGHLTLWCIEAVLAALLIYGTLNEQRSIPPELVGASTLTFTLLALLSMAYRHASTVGHRVVLAGTFCVGGMIGIELMRRIHTHVARRAKSEKLARYLANMNARLRDLDKQKTTFLSIATHQLRSPIAAITGYTSLIHDGSYGAVPKKLEEPLGRIFESGKRLALIVDDFLNVTRIEQGRMSYTMAQRNMAELVREAVEELRVIAKQKGLTLDLSVAPDLDARVNMDASKIKQVLSNVIDNAIKYTPGGSVTVSVVRVDTHHAVMVEVRDTGIGIAPEEQSKLFQKFNRASNVSEVSVYGTGLGLYIAREIVRAHNGWIHLASAGVGKGSTFTIELPLVREDVVASSKKD